MAAESTVLKFDVREIADLARIELDENQIAQFQQQINDIVGYVEQLGEVDVDGIEPTAHAIPVVDVLRADRPTASLPRAAVLANAPAVINETCIRVPAILAGDEEGA